MMWPAIRLWMSSGALKGALRSGLFVSTTATTLLTSNFQTFEPLRSSAAMIGIGVRSPWTGFTEMMSCIPSSRSSCHSFTSRMILSACSM